MKTKHIMTAAIGLALTASCVDYNDATQPVEATVQLVMPAEFTQGTDYEGHTVTLTGTDGSTYHATTDAQGQARFTGLTPLQYVVSTTWSVDTETYSRLTGSESNNTFATVTGTQNGVIIRGSGETVSLTTNLVEASALVISKVYYTGRKYTNDAGRSTNYLYDKYVEIYNQSDNPMDVGGLYMGFGDPNSKVWTAENIEAVDTLSGYTPAGQIFQIPDESRMLQPGEAIVVAVSAVNHNELVSTELLDLSTADYETTDSQKKILENPAVKDMNFVYSIWRMITNMNLVGGGPLSVFIFNTDDDVDKWKHVYQYPGTTTTSNNPLKLVPNSTIVDAVEFLKYNTKGPVDATQKRLVPTLDAGFANASAIGGLTGEVMYRKVSGRRGAAGQLILTDTNNSTNDFGVSTSIKPRQYEE